MWFNFNTADAKHWVSRLNDFTLHDIRKLIDFWIVHLKGKKLCRGLLNVLPLHSRQNICELTYAVASWSIPRKEVFDICSSETCYLNMIRFCLLLHLSTWNEQLWFRKQSEKLLPCFMLFSKWNSCCLHQLFTAW